MKKNIYSLFMFVMAMATLVACSDDNDYQWASMPNGEQVYFSKDLPAQQLLSMEKSSFKVPVYRINTEDALTVNILLTSEDDFFTAPATVTFAPGQAVAEIVISYDPSLLEYDKFREAKLTILNEEFTTIYGDSVYSFTAGVLSPFETIGEGTLVEDYFWGYETKVTIMQNQNNPNVYRIYGATDPIVNATASPYLELTICKPGDTYRGVTVTQEDLVYFEDFNTGYNHSSYGADIMWYHPSKFTATGPESYWLHNVVLAYAEDGTPGQIQLAPRYYMDGVGGWNPSQSDGIVVITFPGFTPKDYSVEMTVSGIYTDLEGSAFAAVESTLGADATNVKAVVVSATDDANAIAESIAAGTMDATEIGGGTTYVPIGDLTGDLKVVMVVLDEDNAIKGVHTSKFKYPIE